MVHTPIGTGHFGLTLCLCPPPPLPRPKPELRHPVPVRRKTSLCCRYSYAWTWTWKKKLTLTGRTHRQLYHFSSKRLEDNWHSGLLSSTKQRSAVMYQLYHFSSKRLEDNWHSGLLSSTAIESRLRYHEHIAQRLPKYSAAKHLFIYRLYIYIFIQRGLCERADCDAGEPWRLSPAFTSIAQQNAYSCTDYIYAYIGVDYLYMVSYV